MSKRYEFKTVDAFKASLRVHGFKVPERPSLKPNINDFSEPEHETAYMTHIYHPDNNHCSKLVVLTEYLEKLSAEDWEVVSANGIGAEVFSRGYQMTCFVLLRREVSA